ncbi:MAG: alpha-1,2-fucosyltransferase [Proteobacteria bacterium]|nr:alpha-1,2-fucosyltransferase [Pseudomonadota bacterium]
MISTHLKGGLGNQMFQIAAAHVLALDNNDECAFFMGNPGTQQCHASRFYMTNVFKKIKELPEDLVIKPNFPEVRYLEPRFNYDPIPYSEGMILQGFFQSEKYFGTHKKEVIELFEDKNIKFRFDFTNTVSIHVRRGDYVYDPYIGAFIPPQPMDYYNRALAFIESKAKIDYILLFSDDIGWCKANFRDTRIIFIEGQADYLDMYLMSKCHHNIIANSSFSWWGAYLNENENIVCAPAAWFGFAFKDDWQDIYCKNWVKI